MGFPIAERILRFSCVAVTCAVLWGCGGTSPYREQALSSATFPDAVYFVIDTSDSMNEQVSTLAGGTESKIDVAVRAVGDLASELESTSALGLRSYPNPASYPCNGGMLHQQLETTTGQAIESHVRGIRGSSNTPTAEALTAAADDIRRYGDPATVILLSDGYSTCDDPCTTARTLSTSTDWTVITIGFDLGDEGSDELRCIAEATGGQYVNVTDGAELEALFSDPDRLFSVTG